MFWRRNVRKGKPLEPLKIIAPPPKNAVEQLLILQEAISQLEALIQSGNIILLKVRALIFGVLLQVLSSVFLILNCYYPIQYLGLILLFLYS